MTRVARSDAGAAGPDYDGMSLHELEQEERRHREAFRDAFGDLQGRLRGEGRRVSGAARRARSGLDRADELVRRHRRVALAASVGLGLAVGYRRRRVVAETPPSERNAEYVLVRRERSRPSPLRAAAGKLAGLAATEALQLAGQLVSERRAAASRAAEADADPGLDVEPFTGAGRARAER